MEHMSAFPTLDQAKREKDNRPPKRGPRWAIDRTLAENPLKKKVRLHTLWLGVGTGLTFSLALWAYEAILFVGRHVAYPWLTLLAGTVLVVAVTSLAALLTHLVNKAVLGIAFWALAAVAVAQLSILVPIKTVPSLMKLLEPGLRSALPDYPITSSFRTWVGVDTAWLALFFAILGLLQLTLVEQATSAATNVGRWVPYFIFIPVMLLASVWSNNQINSQLRAPLLVTDDLIQFAVDNRDIEVDPLLARQMHLSSVKLIADLLNRPRRLFLGSYDESYWQVEVLIDFDGEWANCTVIHEQPVFCEPPSNP